MSDGALCTIDAMPTECSSAGLLPLGARGFERHVFVFLQTLHVAVATVHSSSLAWVFALSFGARCIFGVLFLSSPRSGFLGIR